MKVTKITRLHQGMYVHICPLCEKILASCCDIDFMPEFSICDCDRIDNKQPVYELYDVDGCKMIRRNSYPRFTAKVSDDAKDLFDYVQWIDNVSNAIEAAKAMNKAAEFLKKIIQW